MPQPSKGRAKKTKKIAFQSSKAPILARSYTSSMLIPSLEIKAIRNKKPIASPSTLAPKEQAIHCNFKHSWARVYAQD
jgi:hypothetical protein